jgi:hypothetical protein
MSVCQVLARKSSIPGPEGSSSESKSICYIPESVSAALNTVLFATKEVILDMYLLLAASAFLAYSFWTQ